MEKVLGSAVLDSMLSPKSITIVGASASRAWATGNQVIRNLRSAGFTGRIEVVNPSGGEIEGVESVASIDLIDPTDTAVVAVGAAGVLGALENVWNAGIRSAIVMSVGLERAALDAIGEFARETGMVVHGPNCMGVINVGASTMIWADEGILTDLPAGNVSLISQSGSGAIFVARSMVGVGFAHVISTGNETATTTADYLRFLAHHPATEVIGVIMESIHDSQGFAQAVAEVRAHGKAVVALKVGRSAAGAAATVAHTGAVLADDAIVTAFFERVGVPLVSDYDELGSSLELLAHLRGRSVGAGRTAAITISGGQAALAADLADVRKAPLANLAPQTIRVLEDALPGVQINNPLDAGGSTTAADDYFERSVDALAADPGVDVVMAIVDSQSTLTDIEIGYEDELVAEIRAAASRSAKPFVLASSSSLTLHPTRIPNPADPVAAVRGIGNAFTAIVAASTAQSSPDPSPVRPFDLPSESELEVFRARLTEAPGPVEHELGQQLLHAYGMPFVKTALAANVEDALRLVDDIGYPLVLKVDSKDIAHRSDVGGVVVGIDNSEALRAAWSRIMTSVTAARPDAHISGMELQEQLTGAVEAFVGAVSDANIGATVGVGLGGVWVELVKDAAHGLAPLSTSQAAEMLNRTKLATLLEGYRNLNPRIDPTGLIDVVARLSWMMADLAPHISECDFNPVLIDPQTGRAVLIDTLIVAAGGAGIPDDAQ